VADPAAGNLLGAPKLTHVPASQWLPCDLGNARWREGGRSRQDKGPAGYTASTNLRTAAFVAS